MSAGRWSDRRLVMWMSALIVVLIIAVSVLAPSTADDDTRPTTYNTGPNGAKAAYLTLQAIGRKSTRWNRAISELDTANANRTTLVLAAPAYLPRDKDVLAAAVKRFAQRGGRVLTTGPTGALLLPGGSVAPPSVFQGRLCRTTPGEGPLAAAGNVELRDGGKWIGAKAEVGQSCGKDPVVIRMPIGGGEAIWWTSASALSNAELKNDANMRLLLLSLGEGRSIIWDESLHEQMPGLWSTANGLPLTWLTAQIALIALLVILTFSRRSGPIREPLVLPRSSPVEFAESMGDLYRKARASTAAVDASHRRFLRVLTRDAAIPQTTLDAGPQAVAAALSDRFGGDWTTVARHLEEARKPTPEETTLRDALALSRALGEDAERVHAAVRPRVPAKDPLRTETAA